MADKIAVVTGSNKGIGFAIVKELCKRGVGAVYLTARDVTRGKYAFKQLKNEELNPEFHQLEVTDNESVKKFDDINVEDVNAFVDWFLNSVKNGTLNEEDFKGTNILPYRTSKIAMCALTRIQQNEVGRNISVNSIHPGFVQTDMTNNIGQLTIEKAAQAPVYVALDVDQCAKGLYFWYDKKERDWADCKAELHVNRQEL